LIGSSVLVVAIIVVDDVTVGVAVVVDGICAAVSTALLTTKTADLT
jgi:hypothetical protein